MSDLIQRFAKLGRPRILVLGDLMLDRYTWGDAERVSPEAPVIVLRADQEEIRPGGAASVAYLLRHLEADVSLAGVIGDDADGRTLRALLRDEGIDDQFIVTDSSRPTTSKQRFVGRASDRHPHQILRVDRESRALLSDPLVDQLWGSLQKPLQQFDAILIADYLKGVCTNQLLRNAITAARENDIPVLVDPGRLTDYSRYRGATLIKPNRIETEFVSGALVATAEQAVNAAQRLLQEYDLSAAMITLDRDGAVVATETRQAVIPSIPRSVYDITGAGDMVLAALGLGIASGMELFDAAQIANTCAGLEIERFGVAPVNRSDVMDKLQPGTTSSASKLVGAEDMIHLAQELRRQGKRIVFTNGCFDLLHMGHVASLEDAAQLGDVLIVGINSDASVKRLKGPRRPAITQLARARMVAALECVHRVLIFDEDTPERLIRTIRPDVLVKGGTTEHIVGADIVASYGGVCHQTSQIPGVSTTAIWNSLVADPLPASRLNE